MYIYRNIPISIYLSIYLYIYIYIYIYIFPYNCSTSAECSMGRANYRNKE